MCKWTHAVQTYVVQGSTTYFQDFFSLDDSSSKCTSVALIRQQLVLKPVIFSRTASGILETREKLIHASAHEKRTGLDIPRSHHLEPQNSFQQATICSATMHFSWSLSGLWSRLGQSPRREASGPLPGSALGPELYQLCDLGQVT